MIELESPAGERPAPIFILVDDEPEPMNRLLGLLPAEWVFVSVTRPWQVLDYAKRLKPTAIFLSEPVSGARRLLQRLRDEVGRPVVILCETWDRESEVKWATLGACACLPHPTRLRSRLEGLKKLMQDFAIGFDRSKTQSVTPNR